MEYQLARPRHAGIAGALMLAGAMTLATPAWAALTLTAEGVADGFSLSRFYADPGAYYGLIGAVNAPGSFAIGSGYARGQIYKFNDVDGQAFGTALASVATPGTPTGIATTGSHVYVGTLGGSYYSVNTTTLALTPLSLASPVNAYYGLWGNATNGHLLAGTYQGLLDIDPVGGAVVQVGNPGGNIDGVTVSPNGTIAYIETNSSAIYGYSLTSVNPHAPVFSVTGLAHGPDGTGVISGGAFDGDIVVNNNDGTVGLINHVTGLETIIANGGARGDLVAPDLSNGTLFLSAADATYRLSCGPGCAIGSTVPEPGTASMVSVGLIGLWFWRRRVGASGRTKSA